VFDGLALAHEPNTKILIVLTRRRWPRTLHAQFARSYSPSARRPPRDLDAGLGRGGRPPAPRDQRYDWAYLFGTVCPAGDAGAALLPQADCEAMSLHLAEISRSVRPAAHAVVGLDKAGWHQTGGELKVPNNISLYTFRPIWRLKIARHRDVKKAIVAVATPAGRDHAPYLG